MLINLETSHHLEDIVNDLSGHLLPAVSITNLFLNIVCIIIFSNKKLFKEKTYKYFIMNSLIDSVFLFLTAFKYLLVHVIDTYFYFSLASICLTNSKIIKTFLTFDKLTRMTGKNRIKASFKTVIAFLILIGFIYNIPLIINYDSFEYLWFKFSYFELMIMNIHFFRNFLLGIYVIGADSLLMYLLIKFSLLLNQAIKDNKSKLENLVQTNLYVAIEMNEQESSKSSNKNVKTIEEYELARQQLSNLILINNLVYSVGWSFSLCMHWLQYGINIFYGTLDIQVGYNYLAYLDLINTFANLIFMWTLGMNFFVYFFYNQNFRFFCLGKRKLVVHHYCFLKPDILKL